MFDFGVHTVLENPRYLLHSIRPDEDELIFLPSHRNLLRCAPFIDGRTPILDGPIVRCSLSDALQSLELVENREPRFIFHMSFCGSTLLARILDRPSKVLVLREPQCLVDLANWKAALLRENRTDARFEPSVRLATALLHRPWQAGETIVVKPSNWANNLLPDFCEQQPQLRPMFIEIGARAFLHAVFRGGNDRLAFTARLVEHLASGCPGDRMLLGSAVKAAKEPLGQLANLAALAHHLQVSRFRKIMARGSWGPSNLTRFEVLSPPCLEAVKAVAHNLGLGLSASELRSGIQANATRYAKAAHAPPFSIVEHDAANRLSEQRYGGHIKRALEWSADCLPCHDDDIADTGEQMTG